MMNSEKCTFGGSLKSGEAFYFDKLWNLAVERDHQYLAEPTPAEETETYEKLTWLKK